MICRSEIYSRRKARTIFGRFYTSGVGLLVLIFFDNSTPNHSTDFPIIRDYVPLHTPL